VRSLHAKGQIINSLLWNDYMLKVCATEYGNSEGREYEFFKRMHGSLNTRVQFELRDMKLVGDAKKPGEKEHEVMLDLDPFYVPEDYLIGEKLTRAGIYMDSEYASQKIKTRHTHTILADDNDDGLQFIQVKYYIADFKRKNLLVLGKNVTRVANCVEGRCPHLIEVEVADEYNIYAADLLKRPVMWMECYGKCYVGVPPSIHRRE